MSSIRAPQTLFAVALVLLSFLDSALAQTGDVWQAEPFHKPLPALRALDGQSSDESIAAVNGFCGEAQRIITSSEVSVSNLIYHQWDAFVGSSATPYSVVEGATPLTYDPPVAPDLPLSSMQHILYGEHGRTHRVYPRILSCKMKNAAYLQATDPTLWVIDEPCQAINAASLETLLTGLPRWQQRLVRRQVVLDEDALFASGAQWTEGFPDSPYPVLYRAFLGGPLHIKASALYISPHPDDVPAPPPYDNFIAFCNATGGHQGFLGSACEPRKWGVRYCHLPSLEYLRLALNRQVQVPVCGTASADPRVCQ
ncbi:hypothetical protein F2Q65_14895 [Thiohalocapsa marina]|uniref:Uncharacterized protein n=1 Tax=Thiohalocapsa marina TaxID=424902 RepID=A0A5M8FH30_9GAMM|nr:hypothetical protein [Thiohalocapsa marina]KAA6183724.1 hypothetical protein F2Q65_14895 [Thiohalocapsa marina]